MSEKLYPSLQQKDSLEQHLNLRIKEINSFKNSFQNINDTKNFYNHEGKKYKKRSKQYKLINNPVQSVDGVIILAVSSTCVTLSVAGAVVPIASFIGAGLCIFSKIAGEYLKRKEQHNICKYTLASEILKKFQELLAKCIEDNAIDQIEYNKLKETFDTHKTNKS